MSERLERYVRAWLLRAESAAAGGLALDPATEVAAATQALHELLPPLDSPGVVLLKKSMAQDDE